MAILAVRPLNKSQSELILEQGDNPTVKRTGPRIGKSCRTASPNWLPRSRLWSLHSAASTIATPSRFAPTSRPNATRNCRTTGMSSANTTRSTRAWQAARPAEAERPTDPRNWSPEIQTGWVKRQVPLYIDVNGNPLVVSSGESIDPPPMVDDDVLQIRISRHESTLNTPQIQKYKNVLNSKAYWGWPAGCLKMLPITANLEIINNTTYFKKTYTIEATSGLQLAAYFDDWGIRPLDRGTYRYWDISTNAPANSNTSPPNLAQRLIVDMFGRPMQKSSFLDGHGQPLTPPSTPVWVAFGTANPPPTGQRLDRNHNNLVDGYQGQRALDFSQIKDADGNRLPNLQGYDNKSKVARM